MPVGVMESIVIEVERQNVKDYKASQIQFNEITSVSIPEQDEFIRGDFHLVQSGDRSLLAQM